MPVTLGLTGAGKLANAFGGSGKGGPTSSTQTTSTNTGSNSSVGTQNATGTSSSTPNLNPTFSSFQQSLVPALSSAYAQASQPVYGAQQVAQVANNGDTATTAATQALTSNLARRGVLNSGASDSGQTQLQQANEANTVNFENNLPLLNYQNQQANEQNILGLSENLTGKALSTNVNNSTQTGSNTNNSTSSSVNNQTQSQFGPGVGSSLLNSTGGILGNAGQILAQGGGKGGGK